MRTHLTQSKKTQFPCLRQVLVNCGHACFTGWTPSPRRPEYHQASSPAVIAPTHHFLTYAVHRGTAHSTCYRCQILTRTCANWSILWRRASPNIAMSCFKRILQDHGITVPGIAHGRSLKTGVASSANTHLRGRDHHNTHPPHHSYASSPSQHLVTVVTPRHCRRSARRHRLPRGNNQPPPQT